MAFNPDDQALLRQTPLLSRLGEADFAQVCATLRACDLSSGQTLLHEGQHGDSLYVLIEGRLSVWAGVATGKPARLTVLHSGAVVGEMSCVDPAPCSASVVADRGCRLAQLDRTLLSSLERAAPSVAVSLIAALIDLVNERLRHTNKRIEGYLARRGTPLPRSRSSAAGARPAGRGPARRSSALPGLTATDVELLGTVAPVRRYAEGAVLAEEGQPGDTCFVIMEGDVEVLKASPFGERLLATLGKGSVVGQMALVDGSPRTATLRTAGPVQAMRLERDLFRRMLSSANPVALRFQKGIAIAGIRQLRMADQRLAGIMSRPEFRMRESSTAMPLQPGKLRQTGEHAAVAAPNTGQHAAVADRRGGTGEHPAVAARRGGTGEHPAVAARRGGTGEHPAVAPRRGGTGEYVAVRPQRGGTGAHPAVAAPGSGTRELPAVRARRGGTGEFAAVRGRRHGTGEYPAMAGGPPATDPDLPSAFDEPAEPATRTSAGGSAVSPDEIRRRLTKSAERRAHSRPDDRSKSAGGGLRRTALMNALGAGAQRARAQTPQDPPLRQEERPPARRRTTTGVRGPADPSAPTPGRRTTTGAAAKGGGPRKPLRAPASKGKPRDEVEEALTFLHAAVREWGLSLDELDEVELVDTPGVPRAEEWRGRRGR